MNFANNNKSLFYHGSEKSNSLDSKPEIIDAHHHFWHFNTNDYGWIDEDMAFIRRDFLPENLLSEIKTAEVDGVVSVQARQSMLETDWLLSLAAQNQFIRGVVGWLPIADDGFKALLEIYASNPKLKALRHVIQGEPDDDFILGKAFNNGIKQMAGTNLAYDILVFEKHLPQTIRFVDAHPQQMFVLDHIAKPKIKAKQLSPWRENMIELARRPNVYCKMSGMVTEADFKNWSEEQLMPYFDVVLNAFGPQRLMFGSDWPVCLVGVEYHQWLSVVKRAIGSLSANEQTQILGKNAIVAYNL